MIKRQRNVDGKHQLKDKNTKKENQNREQWEKKNKTWDRERKKEKEKEKDWTDTKRMIKSEKIEKERKT